MLSTASLLFSVGPAMGDDPSRSPSIISRASKVSNSTSTTSISSVAAIKFARQAEKLSHLPQDAEGTNTGAAAVRAEWITPQDPIIVTADGGRLPTVPLAEAMKLNQLRDEIGLESDQVIQDLDEKDLEKMSRSTTGSEHSECSPTRTATTIQRSGEGSLRRAMAPSRTNPLFPPLPLYGPPSKLRDVQCMFFRISSFFLSLGFLLVIMLGALFTSIPAISHHLFLRLIGRNPDERRPFHKEEERRKLARKEAEMAWKRRTLRRNSETKTDDKEDDAGYNGFIPTEGGPDPLVCDIGYYARRVGLDVEEFRVQTEDGFIILLWHVYDPHEFSPLTAEEREHRGPDIFTGAGPSNLDRQKSSKRPKFPVLMIHGLLQSAGAYCVNDDDSFAFYLCKSGYDVWLGNNRCGFKPEHTLLSYSDPRMWAWNIRQMGVMDLPAMVSRVLAETGFEKLGLIAHSQGTTETFVALAKEQRPDLGDKITVFCALAPAAYASPLIGKMYFKFMRVISPAMFRIFFGIHAFIPFMMTMHALLPGKLYGAMGYRIFSFLFNWTDDRWDMALRDRFFQFAPVYVSAESMRWWLGRECFAKQRCILATKEEARQEDVEDQMEEYYQTSKTDANESGKADSAIADNINTQKDAKHHLKPLQTPIISKNKSSTAASSKARSPEVIQKHRHRPKGSTAWYDSHCPPFALWICGCDDLVDGRRLLRRFEKGREPHVKIVHAKIIEEYEHLDVIWAIDAVEKVGKEIRGVLWATAGKEVRNMCRMPVGCEEVGVWVPEEGMKEKEKAAKEKGSGGDGGVDETCRETNVGGDEREKKDGDVQAKEEDDDNEEESTGSSDESEEIREVKMKMKKMRKSDKFERLWRKGWPFQRGRK